MGLHSKPPQLINFLAERASPIRQCLQDTPPLAARMFIILNKILGGIAPKAAYTEVRKTGADEGYKSGYIQGTEYGKSLILDQIDLRAQEAERTDEPPSPQSRKQICGGVLNQNWRIKRRSASILNR
jgi:hypothetical protein